MVASLQGMPLQMFGIKDVSMKSKIPQPNAICKQMHQTMAILLRSHLLAHSPKTCQDVAHLVDDGLVTTMYTMRSTTSAVLKASLGAPLFSHDMF